MIDNDTGKRLHSVDHGPLEHRHRVIDSESAFALSVGEQRFETAFLPRILPVCGWAGSESSRAVRIIRGVSDVKLPRLVAILASESSTTCSNTLTVVSESSIS